MWRKGSEELLPFNVTQSEWPAPDMIVTLEIVSLLNHDQKLLDLDVKEPHSIVIMPLIPGPRLSHG